jgi:hypothetical protein
LRRSEGRLLRKNWHSCGICSGWWSNWMTCYVTLMQVSCVFFWGFTWSKKRDQHAKRISSAYNLAVENRSTGFETIQAAGIRRVAAHLEF